MKYSTEQSVYYMHEDKIKKGSISSVITIKHQSDDLADLQLVGKVMALFTSKDKLTANKSGTYYITTDGIFFEDEVFSSKDDLIGSL